MLNPKDSNIIADYLAKNDFNLSIKTVIIKAGAGNRLPDVSKIISCIKPT